MLLEPVDSAGYIVFNDINYTFRDLFLHSFGDIYNCFNDCLLAYNCPHGLLDTLLPGVGVVELRDLINFILVIDLCGCDERWCGTDEQIVIMVGDRQF